MIALTIAVLASSPSFVFQEEQEDSFPRFVESRVIEVNAQAGGKPLQCFTLRKDGMILAGCGGQASTGGFFEAPALHSGELLIIDPTTGDKVESRPLEIIPEAMDYDQAKGHLYIVGQGKVLVMDDSGEVLKSGAAPHAKGLGSAESLRKTAETRLKEQRQDWAQQLQMASANILKFQGKSTESLTQDEKLQLQMAKSTIDSIHYVMENGTQTVESIMNDLRKTRTQVSSLSLADGAIFFAVRASNGVGFDVWKCAADLEEGERIVRGLRGCCGQMDVQCCGDRLYVAENSRHRVSCYDLDGKVDSHFGARASRGSSEGFGGCCNPMNLAFTSQGDILAAESEGAIKFFNAKGEEQGIAAKSKLPSGCKNVSIRLSEKGDHLYLIDIYRGKIVTFEAESKTRAL